MGVYSLSKNEKRGESEKILREFIAKKIKYRRIGYLKRIK